MFLKFHIDQSLASDFMVCENIKGVDALRPFSSFLILTNMKFSILDLPHSAEQSRNSLCGKSLLFWPAGFNRAAMTNL